MGGDGYLQRKLEENQCKRQSADWNRETGCDGDCSHCGGILGGTLVGSFRSDYMPRRNHRRGRELVCCHKYKKLRFLSAISFGPGSKKGHIFRLNPCMYDDSQRYILDRRLVLGLSNTRSFTARRSGSRYKNMLRFWNIFNIFVSLLAETPRRTIVTGNSNELVRSYITLIALDCEKFVLCSFHCFALNCRLPALVIFATRCRSYLFMLNARHVPLQL